MGLAGSGTARRGVVARGPNGLAAREGRQLTASGGKRAVSKGDGSGIEATPSPGSSKTTISVEELSTYHLELRGSCGRVQVFVLFLNFTHLHIIYVTRMNIIYSLLMYRYI